MAEWLTLCGVPVACVVRKKKKLEKKFEEALERARSEETKKVKDSRTAAQKAFDAVQEKRVCAWGQCREKERERVCV